jgi:hypothetical protein
MRLIRLAHSENWAIIIHYAAVSYRANDRASRVKQMSALGHQRTNYLRAKSICVRFGPKADKCGRG